VVDWLANVGAESWKVVLESAPYILLGLLAAGLLHAFLPSDFVRRAMGGNSLGAVLRAAGVGAPLPLCSCGVIPTALYLRREGAGRGPVLSFLISTPETNVDSIALTYALMGPIMAVARPVAAVFTAVFAGIGEKLLGLPDPHAGGSGACACPSCESRTEPAGEGRGGVAGALKYGSVVLMRDLAPWLVLGLALAGVIGGSVPRDFFRDHLGAGLVPMLLMVLLAAPMYMCATASTPVAAALVLKGISPGAALVFLLVGPATNVATMTAVGRFLGKRSLVIYLASMVGASLLLGMGLDALAGARVVRSVSQIAAASHGASSWVHLAKILTAGLFLLLVANGLRLRLLPRWRAWRGQAGEPGPAGAGGACEQSPASCCSAAAPVAAPAESPEAAHGCCPAAAAEPAGRARSEAPGRAEGVSHCEHCASDQPPDSEPS
jgi:uncharacterized membrane protein YraQ (UPF0718 family)